MAISITSIYSWFIWNLLHIIHDLTSHMHFSMLWIIALTFDGLLELYNCVSSAYSWCDTGWLPITHERGWVYMMKRIGKKTKPWQTPQWIVAEEDSLPSIDTVCVLPERYDLNHARVVPWKPKVCSKCWNNMSLLIVYLWFSKC